MRQDSGMEIGLSGQVARGIRSGFFRVQPMLSIVSA
jgi:hypothetical protein